MNDDGRWLINKIEIRSFLGVGPDGITVDLSHPVTVLEGPSGSGKSTIVSAIEWALFGSVANSPDYSVSGVGGNNASTHRALIHSGQNQASVKLEFESQGGQLSWVRTRSTKNPRPDEDVVTCLLNGSEVETDADLVYQIFGLDEETYRRGVAPKQTTIRNLTHNEAKERNEALDYLFGIEPLNHLSVGLSKGNRIITGRVKDLTDRFDNVAGNLKQPVSDQFDRRVQARQLALESGLTKDDLSHRGLLSLVNSIATRLNQPASEEESPLQDLKSRLKTLTGEADTAWKDAGPQGLLEQLSNIVNSISRVRDQWLTAQQASQVSNDKLAESLKASGSVDSVEKEIADQNERLELTRSALSSANSRAAVLESADVWLKEHSHESEVPCPVCEKPSVPSELGDAIQSSLEILKGSDGEISNLEEQIQAARNALNGAENTKRELDAAISEDDRLAKVANENRSAVAQAIDDTYARWKADTGSNGAGPVIQQSLEACQKASSDTKDPEGFDSSLRTLTSDATRLRDDVAREVETAGNAVNLVRGQIASAERLITFLEEDSKLTDMDGVLSDQNLSIASAGVETAKGIGLIVKALADAAGDVSNTEAKKITESLTDPLSKWFERISQHDLLKKATVTAQVNRAGGVVRNSYQIRATDGSLGNPVPAGHNLSGGYEMVLAVSALCAIQELGSLNHKIGLFILDEPTESLDEGLTEAMGNSLGLHAPGPRTIITTNRPEFARFIHDSAGAIRANIVKLDRWTTTHGTRLGG